MQWSPEDKIGVFGNTAVNSLFSSTNVSPVNKTSFRGSLPDGDFPVKAYYPYVENVTDISAIPVTIPNIQVYKDEASVSKYDFKAASSCELQKDGTYHMQFRQMTTMLRLQIKLDGVNGLASDEKVQSVNIEVDGHDLSGFYTYDLNNLELGLNREPVQGTDLYTWVTVELDEKPLVSDNVTAYAVIAPDAMKDAVIIFKITTDKHVATFSTKLLKDICAGVFYDIPLTPEVINTKEDLKIEELAKPNPDPAPTEEETANCYMINTIGKHDFCATQIGNGDKGIIPGAGFHVSSANIAPKSAKLIWQDVENFIDAGSIRLENGRVHYTANKNSGNAMIAVYSGENCTGDIIWSWHIWGVGDEMPGDDEITNRAGAKFMVMDRALGTHASNPLVATLYQWGRKDPIPNSPVYFKGDGTKENIKDSYPIYIPMTEEEANIRTSVLHCDKIIDVNAENKDPELSWLSYENMLLWGDNNTEAVTDITAATSINGWTNQKTIYDPSPVGYRVPNIYTFTGFAKFGTDGSVGYIGSANIIIENGEPKYDNGYYFKRNDTDNVGTYFPMLGNRFGSDGSLYTITGYYLSSPVQKGSSYTDANKGFCFSIQNQNSSDVNKVVYHTMGFTQKVETKAVRCVRE